MGLSEACNDLQAFIKPFVNPLSIDAGRRRNYKGGIVSRKRSKRYISDTLLHRVASEVSIKVCNLF